MSKIRFSYRRGAIFDDFGRCKITCYFGLVLGGSWRRFSELFGRFWRDFGPFEKESNFEAEVGSRKSGFKATRGASGRGSGVPNNDR